MNRASYTPRVLRGSSTTNSFLYITYPYPCMYEYIYIYTVHISRKSKNQTLPMGSREFFIWIILKTILCLLLDFQDICRVLTQRLCFFCRFSIHGKCLHPHRNQNNLSNMISFYSMSVVFAIIQIALCETSQ